MEKKEIEKAIDSNYNLKIINEINLNEWLMRWLKVYVRGTVKQRTYFLYSLMIDLHIVPELGHLRLCDIEQYSIQKYINNLGLNGNKKNNAGLSYSSINLILSILKNSLDRAVIAGVIKQNPCVSIRKPKRSESHAQCLTESEQQKLTTLLINNGDNKSFGVLLALFTGVRIGELLALKWTDIDMKKNLISISKTTYECKQSDGKWRQVVDSPKTSQSVRTIPISSTLKKILVKHMLVSQSEYVVDHKGQMMRVRTYQCYFKRLLEINDIRVMSFHSLRHIFATRMISIGIDVKTVSELLGHKDTIITLNRYVHSQIEQKKRAMNSLSRIIINAIEQ